MAKKNSIEKEIEQKKRAVIYCRVSTAMQGAADYSSLEAQEDQLKAFCKGKDWEVVDIFKDMKSGGTLERDELNNLLLEAEKGKYDVIVVTKIDRLSRSLMDFKNINKKFNDLEMDFVSATQSIDTTTSGGRFMQDIFMAFAEFERNIIAERTRESMYQRARQGHWNGGHLILGYDVKNKKLEVNPTEAALVNKIFDYYIENPSALAVARRLTQEGIKTKTRSSTKVNEDGEKIETSQPGGDFTKSSVIEVLTNKTYIGLRKYKTEIFPGIHESIVTDEKFSKVQTSIESSLKYTQSNRKQTSSLILLGITRCGLCQTSLTTSTGKGGQYSYYKCSRQAHQTKDQCQAKQLPAEMLEKFVIDTMQHLAENNSFFEAAFKQIKFNKGDDLKKFEDELTILKSNKTKLETQVKNMSERMANDPEISNSKKYLNPINGWHKEIDELSEVIRIKSRNISKIKSKIVDENQLRNKITKFVEIFRNQPLEMQRRLTKLIFTEIVSEFKSNEKDGLITLKIRGNGNIAKRWTEIKSANCKPVRTPVGFGSASKTRTCNRSVNSRLLHH